MVAVDRDIMDNIHNFLFHLFDLGMRSKTNMNEMHENKDDSADEEKDIYNVYDGVFEQKKEYITNQRKKLGFSVERLSENDTKFNRQSGYDDHTNTQSVGNAMPSNLIVLKMKMMEIPIYFKYLKIRNLNNQF